jgi:hypothetical protein
VVATVAENEAAAAGFEDVRLTCGDGEAEWRAAEDPGAEAEAEAERDRDGVGDDEGRGSIEMVGDGDSGSAAPTGTVVTDGMTMVGPAPVSVDGPTARTATQTTSATRTVRAARKTRRAGLTGAGECLEAGNDRPFRKAARGNADYPITACP